MKVYMTIRIGGNIPQKELEHFSKMTDAEIEAEAKESMLKEYEPLPEKPELLKVEVIRD